MSNPTGSLSRSEKKVNKKLKHVQRRQLDQSYLNPDGIKSALVTGEEAGWQDRVEPHITF